MLRIDAAAPSGLCCRNPSTGRSDERLGQLSTEGRGEPLFRCEFVAHADEVAEIVVSAAITRSKVRTARTVGLLEIVFGVIAMTLGLSLPNAVLVGVGLVATAVGAIGAHGCSHRGLRRRYEKVYAKFPSAGQSTVVEVVEDRISHTTPSAYGEWAWSHYESA